MNIFNNRKRINQVMFVLALLMVLSMLILTLAPLLFR